MLLAKYRGMPLNLALGFRHWALLLTLPRWDFPIQKSVKRSDEPSESDCVHFKSNLFKQGF